ncbi:MAG: tail fiber protein [Proteobacteria bacterium]|nr:tail fiber protein [Pseudomonadota bacterium]
MSEPFIAEIKIFAGNFAPRGWAFCNGQLLPIAQNTALFSLIGTTYGGDGRTTTGLPNLQGRAPMHPGQGPGLTSRRLGQQLGVETVTLSEAQMPSHTHNLNADGSTGGPLGGGPNAPNPVGNFLGASVKYSDSTINRVDMQDVSASGGNQSHNNMQPYLTMNYIIALVGLFPSRN